MKHWKIAILLLLFIISGCKSDPNSPDTLSSDSMQLYKFQTVESDLSLLKNCGMPLPEGDAVFSIGWNEIFRPFDDNSGIKGMAFAVAFGDNATESTNFPRFGLDMGTIKIGYAGNEIEMHKMFHENRGTAYSLFNRPFGASDVLLQYIPGIQYTFNVSGSESFSPVTISLTSPSSLMKITSHNHGEVINPAEDLTIKWEGGNPDGKIAIRIMPHLAPRMGEGMMGGRHHQDPPPPGPNPGKVFVEILENNNGEYTFTPEQLQSIIADSGAERIIIDISQFDLGVVQHDGKILRTAMRNSTSVMLNLQ